MLNVASISEKEKKGPRRGESSQQFVQLEREDTSSKSHLCGEQRPVTTDTCPLSSRHSGGGDSSQSPSRRPSPEAAGRRGRALRWRPAPPAGSAHPTRLQAARGAPDASRPQLRRSEGLRGAGPGRGRGRGGGASGRSRAPPRLRALSRRPGVPVQPLPPMGEVEPGPAGPLEPPEPPEAPASRRPGGIRVLKVRRADRRVGEGAKAGSGRPCLARRPRRPATPAPRQSVRWAARPPRSPARGAAAPARGLRAGPRRGLGRLRPLRCPSLAASHPLRRPTPGVQRPPGRRRQPAPPGPGGPPCLPRPGAAPGVLPDT